MPVEEKSNIFFRIVCGMYVAECMRLSKSFIPVIGISGLFRIFALSPLQGYKCIKNYLERQIPTGMPYMQKAFI